eukprot:SAG31_NODE_1866_length_7025_cov_2.554017_2_plen_194_part_00
MLAQITRINRWLDDCCRPIGEELVHAWYTRRAFIEGMVVQLESSHHDVVAEMLAIATPILGLTIGADGKLLSARSGRVVWEPPPADKMTIAFTKLELSPPSAAAATIGGMDTYVTLATPFCHELPQAMMGLIAADPTGEPAVEYRRYVRTVLMPLFRRVAGILREHSAVVEWPSISWLETTFVSVRSTRHPFE